MAGGPGLRQGELFAGSDVVVAGDRAGPAAPPLLRQQLLAWQERLAAHQAPRFRGLPGAGAACPGGAPIPSADPARPGGQAQGELFAGPPCPATAAAQALDPLSLEAQSLSFWRWPAAPHQGAAVYLVLDRPPQLSEPLLLYVGETGRADRRWKGDHDCKSYLAAYSEALRRSELEPRLSIRFWCDAPAGIAERRAIEQALIRLWLPPFNKETRERWSTPFTADPR